jgi:NitT/TauT family transport system permease protein
MRAVLIGASCALWEWAVIRSPDLNALVGQPSHILSFFWRGIFVDHRLLTEGGYTLTATLMAFVGGSLAGVAAGLVFSISPALEKVLQPIFIGFNSLPRIALAPLFLLWFGLGMGSKVALAVFLTFFIVLDSTLAGVRSVDADHLTLARTLGATRAQVFVRIALVSALPTLFTGLRLGLIFSLLGVIGGEIIASEHGLGQYLSFLAGSFDTNGVFAVLLLLGLAGTAFGLGMQAIERKLLHWE